MYNYLGVMILKARSMSGLNLAIFILLGINMALALFLFL